MVGVALGRIGGGAGAFFWKSLRKVAKHFLWPALNLLHSIFDASRFNAQLVESTLHMVSLRSALMLAAAVPFFACFSQEELVVAVGRSDVLATTWDSPSADPYMSFLRCLVLSTACFTIALLVAITVLVFMGSCEDAGCGRQVARCRVSVATSMALRLLGSVLFYSAVVGVVFRRHPRPVETPSPDNSPLLRPLLDSRRRLLVAEELLGVGRRVLATQGHGDVVFFIVTALDRHQVDGELAVRGVLERFHQEFFDAVALASPDDVVVWVIGL